MSSIQHKSFGSAETSGRMRFVPAIIPPRMVAMGFLSCRSESLVLCGRTEAANAIAFGENSLIQILQYPNYAKVL
jgi:hypothetical protein